MLYYIFAYVNFLRVYINLISQVPKLAKAKQIANNVAVTKGTTKE
jgi:hypothetical protein